MPAKILLLHDWKDYDNRKIREKHSTMIFCCRQQWESRYLASKIKQLYPERNMEQIHEIIRKCCNENAEFMAREEFVKLVMTMMEEYLESATT